MSDDEVRAKCVEAMRREITNVYDYAPSKDMLEVAFDGLGVKPWYRLADGRWTFIEKAGSDA